MLMTSRISFIQEYLNVLEARAPSQADLRDARVYGSSLVITIVDLEALVDVNVALKLVKLVRRRDVVYDRDEVQLQFRVSRTLKKCENTGQTPYKVEKYCTHTTSTSSRHCGKASERNCPLLYRRYNV